MCYSVGVFCFWVEFRFMSLGSVLVLRWWSCPPWFFIWLGFSCCWFLWCCLGFCWCLGLYGWLFSLSIGSTWCCFLVVSFGHFCFSTWAVLFLFCILFYLFLWWVVLVFSLFVGTGVPLCVFTLLSIGFLVSLCLGRVALTSLSSVGFFSPKVNFTSLNLVSLILSPIFTA